ncbi:MAG: response regulator transcription factor, partial [Bacteroidales bacterium]|nr:response regulator transcription factor [Bacteroidales bacterium]
VDDERDIAEILQFNLIGEGYSVQIAFSAEEALPIIQKNDFDCILLDVMMGEISGFGLASLLKKDPQTANIPIIFITALNGEEETVKGLDLGADDYIAKPLSMAEVKARVRAVLRRTQQQKETESPVTDKEEAKITYEGIVIDLLSKTLKVNEKPIALTHLEFELLVFLLQHKDRVYSRNELLDKLWPDDTVVLERTIDVNITRIRKKIEPYGDHIKTKTGYGYYFES